jgi:hypothetical protein
VKERLEARGAIYVFLLVLKVCLQNCPGILPALRIGGHRQTAWIIAWVLPFIVDVLLICVLLLQSFDFHGSLSPEIKYLVLMHINTAFSGFLYYFREFMQTRYFGINVWDYWLLAFTVVVLRVGWFANLKTFLDPDPLPFGQIAIHRGKTIS